MTHSEREAELLTKVARVRSRVADLVEELSEAGLEKTADRVRIARANLDDAKQMLLKTIRKADDQ